MMFIFRLKLQETGDYEICLDNTESILSSKTIYFEISVEVNPEKLKAEDLDYIIDNESNDTISLLRVRITFTIASFTKEKNIIDLFL